MRGGLLSGVAGGLFDPNADIQLPDEPQPQSAAPAQPGQPVFGLVAPPQQKRPEGMLATGARAFLQGFAPQGYQAGVQRAKADEQDQIGQTVEKMKKALAWSKQALSFPDEAQTANFINTYGSQMERDTGHMPQYQGRAKLEAETKALEASLGALPQKPDYQFMQTGDGGIGVGDKSTGKVTMAVPNTPKAPPKRETGKDVNGVERYLDTHEEVFPGVSRRPEELTPYQKAQLTMEQKRLDASTGANGPKMNNVTSLRGQYLTQAKPFIEVRDAFQRMNSLSQNDSAAGDISLVFNYMKINDPGSTVREGEFATAQNAAGVPAQLMNQYNKLMSGERLNPDQRKDFLATAKRLYQGQESTYKQTLDFYRGEAERNNVDPSAIPDLRVRGADLTVLSGNAPQQSADPNLFRSPPPAPQPPVAPQPRPTPSPLAHLSDDELQRRIQQLESGH